MKIAIFDCPVNHKQQSYSNNLLSHSEYEVSTQPQCQSYYLWRSEICRAPTEDMQMLLHTTRMNNRRNCLVISKPLKNIAALEKVCKTFQSKTLNRQCEMAYEQY